MESRYGGYWRYPRIRDFCYLVNPYFPNKRLMSELKANFERLVREYPSGMRVNSLLAAKYFGISQEYICIGNGAAELIKALMSRLEGKMGVIYPTFEEYPNRVKPDMAVPFHTASRNFTYTADDLMEFFPGKTSVPCSSSIRETLPDSSCRKAMCCASACGQKPAASA